MAFSWRESESNSTKNYKLMKNILNFIVTSIVDEPDKVVINEFEEDGILNFSISVASNDIGKIIGKEGKVIRGIRNIMKIPAMKQEKRVRVEIAETESQTQTEPTE